MLPDHPRSRGVYMWVKKNPHENQGSSPLARGLHRIRHALPVETGIIPARAGFTITARIPERLSADHPRSRGVYGPRLTAMISGVGSSPLARGLPTLKSLKIDRPRIIPARAGFTDDVT